MGFSLFNKQSKEEKFWNWFTKNQETYFKEIENLEIREQIFNNLSTELKKVQNDLVFEFSPIHENGIREFTVSADGIKENFPSVTKLIEKAPKIENWQFNAFRQRIPGDEIGLNFGDFKISYDDLFFRYQEVDGELGVELNIRDYNGEGMKQNAVYILLDNLLGEYDTTVSIGWIDWEKLDESKLNEMIPIIKLRDLIDKRKAE
jgi:hypothetical protein